MNTTDRRLLEVGRIGRPHGVRGDTYLSLSTDVLSRAAAGAELFAGDADAPRRLVITSSRPEKGRFVVHFEGVDDRESAARLTNLAVRAAAIEDPEALWVHDLVGSRVVTAAGLEVGTCTAVVANPAHSLVEVDTGVLVPVPFVVSCRAGVTVIDPPDGLLDDPGT